jgi:glycosyltransferase involved in cell wall biosynthesis
MQTIFLNGRFLSQPFTGVQRFAMETTAAIDRLAAREEWPNTTVLAPRASVPSEPHFERLRVMELGTMRGNIWEQTELPIACRSGILVNLGNTGPLLGGRRQIVVIHDAGAFDTPESYSLQFRTWYRLLQRRLASCGAKVVTVSEFSRNRIVRHLDIRPDEVTVMYEGADHILRTSPDAGTLDRYGLARARYVLVVGNTATHKNIGSIGSIATLLNRRGIELAIVGSVNSSIYRQNSGCATLGKMLGRVTDSELRALYDSALCLLFPSKYEGFGLPPVEAMACGCPVLTSRGGAVEEICGDAAMYFNPDDSRTMTEAVEFVLEDEQLLSRLRERGLERAARFRWDASAQVLAGVVRELQQGTRDAA